MNSRNNNNKRSFNRGGRGGGRGRGRGRGRDRGPRRERNTNISVPVITAFKENINSEELFPTLVSNSNNNANTTVTQSIWGSSLSNVKSISDKQEKNLKIAAIESKKIEKAKDDERKLQMIELKKEKEKLAILKDIEKYCKGSKNDFVKERLIKEAGIFSDDEEEETEAYNDDFYYDDRYEKFYDKNDTYWQLDYVPMINHNENYQRIYEVDSNGYIYKKWINGTMNNYFENKLFDNKEPEDFGNYHPDDESYIDPREEELYYLFGNEIEIGYNGYTYKRKPCGIKNNGTLMYNREKIYRAIYPIFGEIIETHHNSPSEKKLRETGQWKDIEWTVLGPNPNYKK